MPYTKKSGPFLSQPLLPSERSAYFLLPPQGPILKITTDGKRSAGPHQTCG